jgi:hypothetical protein
LPPARRGPVCSAHCWMDSSLLRGSCTNRPYRTIVRVIRNDVVVFYRDSANGSVMGLTIPRDQRAKANGSMWSAGFTKMLSSTRQVGEVAHSINSVSARGTPGRRRTFGLRHDVRDRHLGMCPEANTSRRAVTQVTDAARLAMIKERPIGRYPRAL